MLRNRMHLTLFTRPLRGGRSHPTRTHHLLPLLHAVLVALVLAAFASVQPAAAAVPGLNRVEAPSPFNSDTIRTAFAACPAGQKVIGGGGALTGAKGRVGLVTLVPNAANTGYTAFAAEVGGGTTENWRVTAYAICANATAVPDLQQFESPLIPEDSTAFKAATVRCPSDKKLVGMGARTLGGGLNAVALMRMFPDQRAVNVGAAEVDAGTSQTWRVQAVALCVNQNSAIDVQRILEIHSSGSVAQLTNNMKCPSGKMVLGGGADTLDASAGRVLIRGITPSTDKLGVAIANGESALGTTQNWSQVSYMLCATP